MKTKHTLIACLTAISFLAINYVALGATVSGVETDKTPPASAQTKPDRGIKSPPRAATVINFDDVTAPCFFSGTTALKSKGGVIFLGTGGNKNGGAILNECSNFGVTGQSSPNFLAFNAGAPMSDGGIPKLPELFVFLSPVSSVQMNAGVGLGTTGNAVIIAMDSAGNFAGFDVIGVASALQTLTVTANDIKLVILAATLSSPILVVDDLAFSGVPSVSAAPSGRQAKDDLDALSDEYKISDEVWNQVKSLLSPQRKLTTTWAEIKSKSR